MQDVEAPWTVSCFIFAISRPLKPKAHVNRHTLLWRLIRLYHVDPSLTSVTYPSLVNTALPEPSSSTSLTLLNSFTLCLKPCHYSGFLMGNLRAFWFSSLCLQFLRFFFPFPEQSLHTFQSGVSFLWPYIYIWSLIFYSLFLQVAHSFSIYFLTTVRKLIFD